ncbi:MAG: hypothetical protein U0Q18_26450 [Bryobacteraceae bacterium]
MRSVKLGLGVLVLISLARAQAPVVNAGGVGNNGSYDPSGVAPGSIVAIFGTNLAGSLAIASTVPLSTTLGNVTSVTFNNIPAPLYFVGPLQIDAQLPWGVLQSGTTTGTVSVVVTGPGGSSAPQNVNIVPTLPGIFTVNQQGTGQAIATDNNDGNFAAVAGSIAGVKSHPISISSGHALVIWCTGLGAVDPPIADGANSYDNGVLTLRRTVATPVVLIGGKQAKVVFSGLAPSYVSENQVDVTLAADTPTGDAIPVQIQINGVTTSDKVTIAVAP